jgi:ABC-type glycerol-3-phosphate transport system substrate-binding protein
LTKIDILNYYRKLIEKSRAFCAAYLNVKRADIFLIVAVIAVLGYLLVNHSCEAVHAPARINIVISAQGGNLFGRDTVDALIREFEEQYPELRIQEVTQEAAAGGTGADIVFFDDSEFGRLMDALASPDSYRPLVSFMDIFMYNIDILKAANLDRPPHTRAAFLAAARAVKAQGAEAPGTNEVPVSAFALGLSKADPLALRRDFYPWIWASGVDIQSIDLSGDNPALPRAVTDAIAFLGQLNREELLAPGTFEKTGAQRLREFAEGKIAMMTISARDIAFVLNNAHDFTFGITALPAVTPGKNRLGLSSIYAGISGASAVPDEARVFLSFLAEKSDVLAEALGAVPGKYPGGFAGEYIEKNELYSKAWDIFEAADIVEYKPGEPSAEAFNHLIRKKLVEALTNK